MTIFNLRSIESQKVFTYVMKRIIYLADDEDEQDAIRDFLETRDIKIFAAQTEEEVQVIVECQESISLIVIGVRENHTSELINSDPCDLIPKVPLIIDENQPRLRVIYSPVLVCLNMDEELWQEKLRELVDSL